jgi:hypothetical protein
LRSPLKSPAVVELLHEEAPAQLLAVLEAQFIGVERAGQGALVRIWASAALPRKIPAALTETERTPAPDSSSRQPPLSLLVIDHGYRP